jgi:hypothetical protein
MTARKLNAVVLGLALAVPGLAACGEPEDNEDRLLQAISRTDRLAYNFVYEDTRPDPGDLPDIVIESGGQEQVVESGPRVFGESRVQGVVEDDFRFKAQLSLAGRPTMEKVVSDDTVAVRLLDPSQLNRFVDRDVVDSVKTDTDRPGISVPEALQSGRWVIDPEGAPQQLQGVSAEREQGIDPILDALTTFEHVRAAIDKAESVDRFSKDDLDPAYRTSEDPFPAPDEDSGVIRYDLRRPRLPAVGAIGGSGQPDVAETEHFRKMAIYVNDEGRVIQVLEKVEITGKQVEEFRTYFNAFLEDVFSEGDPSGGQIISQFKQGQEAALREGGEEALGEFLLTSWSIGAAQQGGEPIDIRTLRLDLQDLGEANEVALPAEDVITGNLAILTGTGRKPTDAEAADAATAGGGAA